MKTSFSILAMPGDQLRHASADYMKSKGGGSKIWSACLTLFLLVALLTTAHAQLTPSSDAYTNSATPTKNYGSTTLLDVDGASQITYIQFNLASIPSGASISQATLKLYVNSVTTAGSFNVDYVNGTWSEGTVDWNNAPPLGTAIASSVPVVTADKNQYLLINVTSALQAWLNGSETNNGIALVANGSTNLTFDSKENTSTSHPAELDVVFAGGDGTITGVNTAAGSGLVGGGTSGTLNLSLTNSCAANQILQWNGSGWACSNAGTGTITGVTAGTDLTGGGTGGNVTLNLNTSATDARYAQLAAANTFTGNQTVNGNLSATGVVTGGSYQIGSNLFAFGMYGNGNAFLGFAGNTKTTGSLNTASGYQALLNNTSGFDNTASGAWALQFNTTGSYDTANGEQALILNTTGSSNTASGFQALASNTTGGGNTASGVQALLSNNTGGYNLADGYQALNSNTTGSNNTASGFEALASNTTGAWNTASGNTALGLNTTGTWNTAIGAATGEPVDLSNLTGSYDTFLGTFSGPSTGTLNNATAIGAYALVGESNALVLGSIAGTNGAYANTNVGIGTTTPGHLLEVDSAAAYTAQIAMVSGGSDAAISLNNTNTGLGGREYWIDSGSGTAGVGAGNFAVWDATAGAVRMVITSLGNVGFGGITGPSHPIQMADGAYESGGTWTNASDRNLKEGFKAVDGKGLLAKLDAIPIESWKYKSESGRVRHIGPMAQDFYASFGLGMDDKHISTVDEGGVALAAIQQLYREGQKKDVEIQAQQAQIKALDEQIRSAVRLAEMQQTQIAQLRSQMKAVQVCLKAQKRKDAAVRTVKANAPLVRQ